MLKKFVGLGLIFSVATAASALTGGCSSTTVNNPGDSGTGATDSSVNHPDGTVQQTEAGSSPASCPNPVDTSMIPAWKAPTQTPGACSDSDVAAINTAIMAANPTFTSIYMAITSASCKSCVFSNSTDPNWQPIVWDPDMATGMGNAIQNFGACYAVAPSGSAACGKGQQDFQFCAESACPTTCTDQQGCVTTAGGTGGTCATQGAEVTTGCGSALMALDTACSNFLDGIKVVCGSGSSDAGTDGG